MEEEGQVSFEYTRKQTRPAFGFHIDKAANQEGIRFITTVIPYENEKPEIAVNLAGEPAIGSNELYLDIKENSQRKTIGYNLLE